MSTTGLVLLSSTKGRFVVEVPKTVHLSNLRGEVESYALCVFSDGSAVFGIVVDNTVDSMRSLAPDENGEDIAITDDVRAWFDRELAAGRAKAPAAEA